VDAKERRKKAKWHADRAGKMPGAKLSKSIAENYQAELLERGVKDSQGNQKPLLKDGEQKLINHLHDAKPLNTRVISPPNFAFRD